MCQGLQQGRQGSPARCSCAAPSSAPTPRPGSTHRLRLGVAIVGRGVEKVDAQIEGFLDCSNALVLVNCLQQAAAAAAATAVGRGLPQDGPFCGATLPMSL